MKTFGKELKKVTLRHRAGEMAEEASVELSSLGGYLPGDLVKLTIGGREREFLVEGVGKELSTRGWVQNLHLLSPVWLETKRSPKKTQIFLTLSPTQYEEFREEYLPQADSPSGRLDSLGYHPWIRLGDGYGEGGWDSNEVIRVLGQMVGLTIHSSVPSYPVRQFTVEPDTPILQAVQNLVWPLEPLVYSVGGQVFITEGSSYEADLGIDNRLNLSSSGGLRMVKEEVVRRDKPSQIRLVGNLGRFRPERFKGTINHEPLKEVREVVGGFLIQDLAYGTRTDTFVTETGSIPFSLVPSVFIYNPGEVMDSETGMIHNFSLEEVFELRGKDIFGNPSFLISQTRATYKYRVVVDPLGISSRLERVLYSRSRTAIQYENTHFSFTTPREFGNILGQGFSPLPGRVSSLDLSVFYPLWGQVVYDLFPNIEDTLTYYWYTRKGELVSQNTITMGVVYTDDGQTFHELKSMQKEEVSPTGSLRRVVVAQELVSYYQMSRDSYGMRRETIRLGADGRYISDVDVQIVQSGAVQGSPVELRKMQVYAETGVAQPGSGSDSTAVMPTRAREISVNTPGWEALESMLPIVQKRLSRDEVIRTYEMLGELDVHAGLQVNLEAAANLDGTEVIPAPLLATDSAPIVVGYEVEKDVTQRRAITRLTVRGRLP